MLNSLEIDLHAETLARSVVYTLFPSHWWIFV